MSDQARRGLSILGAFMLLGALLGACTGGDDEEASNSSLHNEPYNRNMPIEARAEQAVQEAIDSDSLGVSLVQHNSGYYEAEVYFRASDHLIPDMRRENIIIDVMEAVRLLSTAATLDSIHTYTFTPYFPIVDEFGNESVEPVGTLQLHRETAVRINWDNMYFDRFQTLMQEEGTFELHPEMY